MASALVLDPGVNFLFAKAPVLSKSNTGQSLHRTPARPPIYPRHWYMQYLSDLLNCQKSVVVSFPRGRMW